jgi:hypothetical protein
MPRRAHRAVALPNTGQNSIPRGGLHGYFTPSTAPPYKGRSFASCPVEEILRRPAVGVRLRDRSLRRTTFANAAVIAAIDVHQAFLKMVGRVIWIRVHPEDQGHQPEEPDLVRIGLHTKTQLD